MERSGNETPPWDGSTVIFEDDEYTVVIEEVGPLWRWLIFRDDLEVQEGASISERSARLCGLNVASYLRGASLHERSDTPPVDRS